MKSGEILQFKTKLVLCGGVVAGAIAIVGCRRFHVKAEARIYQQIKQQFANQTVYGTWLRPEYQLLAEDYYLGGVNILADNTIIEYQFTANRWGRIIDLAKTGTTPAIQF
ncbi:hypothetical protein [Lactobacillus sp. Sy-1]|uniref:hypothetical protein n=1 Tax=Lactobacillus sp. Sy-1 TaxID=2109645 RepID=UPI001C5832F5|nr:hypothetical protein [Lactobacillus sp. Sy-1]MBW1605710.1 hypothetical protein [Lactobacillus sp. Sy-1]